MDNRNLDIYILELKLDISFLKEINITSNFKEVFEFLYKQHYQDKRIILDFIYNFLMTKLEVIKQLNYKEIKDYSELNLNKIFSFLETEENIIYSKEEKEKLKCLLTLIIASRDNKNNSILKAELIKCKNFSYEKNTLLGYLYSEFNITLLRLYSQEENFSLDMLTILNNLMNEQKELNTWVINYYVIK